MVTDVWDSTIDRVREAVDSHLRGHPGDAEAALRAIDEAALIREYDDALRRVQGVTVATASVVSAQRPSRVLPPRSQIEVFRRDHFTCRYCGRGTLFAPTLRALSILYPDALLYHKHGKFGAGHRLYWTHQASCDHIEPVAHGGNSDAANLATACYLCNHTKGQARLEELGWEARTPTERYWDGLSGLFSRLCLASPAIRESGDLGKWKLALD